MMRNVAILLCIAVFVSGCATTADYRFRVGDEIRVVIWKELDEKVIVRPDKKISLPLVEEVSCKDKTPEELSKELTEKYEIETTVIVSKYHTLKDDFKEVIGIIRDIAVTYFIGERIINSKKR